MKSFKVKCTSGEEVTVNYFRFEYRPSLLDVAHCSDFWFIYGIEYGFPNDTEHILLCCNDIRTFKKMAKYYYSLAYQEK
jgi:hypothetical protein